MKIEPLSQRVLVLGKIVGEPIVLSLNFLKDGKLITFAPSFLVHGKKRTNPKSLGPCSLCSPGHSYISQRYLTIQLL